MGLPTYIHTSIPGDRETRMYVISSCGLNTLPNLHLVGMQVSIAKLTASPSLTYGHRSGPLGDPLTTLSRETEGERKGLFDQAKILYY